MLLLWLVVLVIGAAYLTHRRLAPLQILGIMAAYVLLMGIFSSAPGWLLAVIWIVLALKIALVALPEWRRKVFTGPVFSWFQRTLPGPDAKPPPIHQRSHKQHHRRCHGGQDQESGHAGLLRFMRQLPRAGCQGALRSAGSCQVKLTVVCLVA